MSQHGNVNVNLDEMIKVIKEEALNLKNAGDLHRAYVLKEAANFLSIQKRNRINND